HQVKVNRPGGILLQAQQLQGETNEQQTEAAIAQAKEARRAGAETDPLAPGDAVSRRDSNINSPPLALPRLSIPGEYVVPGGGSISAGDSAGEFTGESRGFGRGFGFAGGGQSGEGRDRNRTAGQPGRDALSIYTSAGDDAKAPAASILATPARSGAKLSFTRKEKLVTLPAFGALLPV